MKQLSQHQRESDRLASVHRVQRLLADDSSDLQRVVQLAAYTFRVPTALISLVGSDEQCFLARTGMDEARTEIATSVCAHAIQQSGVFEITDLGLDERFRGTRLVSSGPRFRYYAGVPLLTADGHALGTLCILDYKPRKLSAEARSQLTNLAEFVVNAIAMRRSIDRRDPVTGLPNRKQFTEELSALCEEEQPSQYLACLVDVFDAQHANDLRQARGVEPMEALLRQAACRLAGVMNGVCHIYHVGVTQFAFLLPCDDIQSAWPLLERAAEALSSPLPEEGIILHPICRGGVVPFNTVDGRDVFRRMISAMHTAVAEGRDWRLYEIERDSVLARRYRLAAEVPEALSGDQFYVMYQPRVSLVSGAVVGAEALLRWRHPELGEVSPAEFIPVIATTPFMPMLTDWVATAAMRQVAAWKLAGLDLQISVNLALGDFSDGSLPDRLINISRGQGVPLSSIELEVTEGEWLHPDSSAASQLSRLRELGASVAIDDFGAGFSNFNYLTRLPIDTVKVDRDLVSGFLFDHTKQSVIQAIVSMAKSIGVRCVAEGVEGAGERELLGLMGCTEGQGYYFSRPVPADEVFARARGRHRLTC